MSKEISIGHVGRQRLTLPANVMTEAMAILGRRGTGKTNTAVVIAEQFLGMGRQVVIIDPVDVWWGLKSKGRGHSGFKIPIFGGRFADFPLESTDGELLSKLIVGDRISAILSTRHLSKSKYYQFMADFAETTYSLKNENRNPCFFIIDEAGTIVPQHLRDKGPLPRCVGAIESWVRQGRASGIGVCLIDQRPATVNKEVLTQVELLVAHQLVHNLDRKAVQEWVAAHDIEDQSKTFMETLGSLAIPDPDSNGKSVSEAWVWSPTRYRIFVRANIQQRKTFDSSFTPSGSDEIVEPSIFQKTHGLDQIRQRLESLRGPDETAPPKPKKAAPPPPARVDSTAINNAVHKVARLAAQLESASHDLRKLCGKHNVAQPDVVPVKMGTKRKILIALAQSHPQRISLNRLAILVQTSAKNGNFANRRGELVSEGLIDSDGSYQWGVTPDGLRATGSYDPLPTNDALRQAWLKKYGGVKGRILEAVFEACGETMTKEDVALRAQTTSKNGNFNNRLGELLRLGLIIKEGRYHYRASPDLFT